MGYILRSFASSIAPPLINVCPGLCNDASLEVFYVNYLSEVFYVENR